MYEAPPPDRLPPPRRARAITGCLLVLMVLETSFLILVGFSVRIPALFAGPLLGVPLLAIAALIVALRRQRRDDFDR